MDDPHDAEEKGNSDNGANQFQSGSESLSSADNLAAGIEKSVPNAVTLPDETNTLTCGTTKAGKRMSFKLICSILFVLLAIFCSLQYIDDHHEYRHLIPT